MEDTVLVVFIFRYHLLKNLCMVLMSFVRVSSMALIESDWWAIAVICVSEFPGGCCGDIAEVSIEKGWS